MDGRAGSFSVTLSRDVVMPEQKREAASSRQISRASTSYFISAAASLARSQRRIDASLLPRQSLKTKVADPAGAEQRTRNMPLSITCKSNSILSAHEQVSRDGKQRQVRHHPGAIASGQASLFPSSLRQSLHYASPLALYQFGHHLHR